MTNSKRVAETSERLKEALGSSGKKQVDIARETGIDKGSISNYMSGRYEPKMGAIKKLAEALNVSEMWLCGYDVPMTCLPAQNNSDIVAAISTIRTDPEFLDVVFALAELPEEEYSSIKKLILVLGEK